MKQEILLRKPYIRHPIHFVCGAVCAYVMAGNPHLGWGIFLGFLGYEAWQDFGYLHDGGFKDLWEFLLLFILVALVIRISGGSI